MLLRLLLALLVGYLLSRLLRRSRPSGPPPRQTSGRRLDPDRAVRASWSEVESDSKGGTGER